MIKQVVQKQMTIRPNRKRVVEQYASDEDDNEEDEYDSSPSLSAYPKESKPKPQHRRNDSLALRDKVSSVTELSPPPPPQPVFKSRIRR